MSSKQEGVLADFCEIVGVGRSTAEQLWDDGARSLADLRADPSRYGLSKNQKLGLEYYEDFKERIPRDEVTEIHRLGAFCFTTFPGAARC